MRIFSIKRSSSIVLAPLLFLLILPIDPDPTSADETKAEAQAFKNAKRFFDHGVHERAITELQAFVARYPKSEKVPDAYYMVGQSYIRLNRFSESADFLRSVVDNHPDSAYAERAGRELAQVYLRIGRTDEAIPLLEREAALSGDTQAKRDLYGKIADLYLSNQDGLKAIESLMRRHRLLADPAERGRGESRIREIIETHLDDPQLIRLAELHPKGFPGDAALMRLSQTAYSRGDLQSAEDFLNRFLTAFPGHPKGDSAREMLTRILEIHKSFEFRIGVLLPLTGEQAPYADSVMKGIELAMEQAKDLFPEHYVGVIARDYEGKVQRLKNYMSELIEEYETIAIIGPLLSRDVEEVAPVAEEYEVPIITPTASRRGVAAGNRYVFRNTVSHELIGRRLTEYAVLDSGLRRFVIFYPKDSYGLEMMKIVSEEVNRLGGEIIVAKSYEPDANDFGKEIRQVIQLDLGRYGALVPPAESDEVKEPEYVPGFDAVFLLGSPFKTGLLAAQLAFHDVKDRMLLVPHGGNSENFLVAGDRHVEGAIGVDSFFEDSPDPTVRNFVGLYQARYQEPPDLFAAQAYDCVQLILLSLKNGALLRDEVRDYIAAVREYHGASGVTTVTRTGQVEKQLFVIQVRNGKFVQVN